MKKSVRLELLPLGQTIEVAAGTALSDALFPLGVEFPCGGRGKCKGCRIRVREGLLPLTAEDQQLLSAIEIGEGWRLACRAIAAADLQLEVAQWKTAILGDDSPFHFHPQEGWGVAVDLGTTTLVAQLLDLRLGQVLGVKSGLNPQARHGADIMSRIDFARTPEGSRELGALIRREIGQLIDQLLADACTSAPRGHPAPRVRKVVIVGNTVMHHLFSGLEVTPLAHHPFEPVDDGLQGFTTIELGWNLAPDAQIWFLPCLGGFVGSDLLAGILATRLHESEALVALVDLGTNGEMVVGNRQRLLCASTAAGPAFEGARISMGMRAANGAIAAATVENGHLSCQVIGHTVARGLCGSGLVDVVAGALELGWIHPSGRLTNRAPDLPVLDAVRVSAADVRELQLAKGAIAAGLSLLLEQWRPTDLPLSRIHLAGAFGNYINRQSARRIGLLPLGPERTEPAGNTALLGAKLALGAAPDADLSFAALRSRVRHVSLNDDPRFHEVYVEHMGFPH